MSKPEDIPQDVRAKAAAAGSALRVSIFELNTGASKLWGSPGVIEEMNLQFARAILAAKTEGLPKLDNCGKYLAQDNTGQWHYINHAGTWQGCPPPFPLTEGREAPSGWKWRMVPDYPLGQVVGACICGSWPGGECLKCPPVGEVNTAHKNSEVQ